MLYSLDVGRRFRPPEGRMRRVIFQKSLLRKNSTTRPSEAVNTREPKYFFSFRGLTCPQSLKKWASYDVSSIFGIFSKSGLKRVRYTAFSSRSACFSSRLAFHDLYFFKISISPVWILSLKCSDWRETICLDSVQEHSEVIFRLERNHIVVINAVTFKDHDNLYMLLVW